MEKPRTNAKVDVSKPMYAMSKDDKPAIQSNLLKPLSLKLCCKEGGGSAQPVYLLNSQMRRAMQRSLTVSVYGGVPFLGLIEMSVH
jgi:hypothetical protein